jgi:electron transfer flavoprotein alpha subunit
VLGYKTDKADFANIEEAEVVVAGGRGMKKAENFALLKTLAERLDAVVGGSRDAVDRGWIDYPYQIGLSGKTISPPALCVRRHIRGYTAFGWH